MTEYQWSVYIQWETYRPEQHVVGTIKELKDYLDRHAFCERHGCPMPESVQISRMPHM